MPVELESVYYRESIPRKVPGYIRVIQALLYLAVLIFTVMGSMQGLLWAILAVGTLLGAWLFMGTVRIEYEYCLDGMTFSVIRHSGMRSRPKSEEFLLIDLANLVIMADEGAEALEPRHALRELLGELGQLANRALHAGNVHVEGDECGDIHLVFHNQIAAHEDDGQAHQVHHQLRAGEEARHHLVIALLGRNVLIRAAGELVDLLILVAERLGDAHAGNGAFDFRVDARRAALDVAGDLHHVASAHRDEQDDHRYGDHQHEHDGNVHDDGIRRRGDVEQIFKKFSHIIPLCLRQAKPRPACR